MHVHPHAKIIVVTFGMQLLCIHTVCKDIQKGKKPLSVIPLNNEPCFMLIAHGTGYGRMVIGHINPLLMLNHYIKMDFSHHKEI